MNPGFEKLLRLNMEAYLAGKEIPFASQQSKASLVVSKDPKPKLKPVPPSSNSIKELEEDLDQSTPSSFGDGFNSELEPEYDLILHLVPTKWKAPSIGSRKRPLAPKVKITAPKWLLPEKGGPSKKFQK